MSRATHWIVAILSSAAITGVTAQTMSSDQQIVVPKDVPKMTPEQKKADKEAKRAPSKQVEPASPNAVVGKDLQVQELKAPKKMTAEQKAADKAAKRKPPTAEEQAQQLKQSPGS